MLGKQWLNRYALTDVRGTAIERSQNRQRKLDGTVVWYFDHVMESLPLMLQAALLLLSGALSRYLWGISITIASVILAVTLLGLIFYLTIVVAGTASESCPYQTPGARILRYVLPRILRTLRSAPSAVSAFVFTEFFRLSDISAICDLPNFWWSGLEQPWYTVGNVFVNLIFTLVIVPLMVPVAIVIDAFNLGHTMYRFSAALGRMLYRMSMGTSPPAHILDLQCISWMLRTTLDKEVHLSTLKHLESLTSMPADFDPTLVAYCFNAFVGCVNVSRCEVVVTQGLDQLAIVSALCFFRAISYLSIMDPTSSVLKDICQRYTKIFPTEVDFHGHQFSHTMNAIRTVFIRSVDRRNFAWNDYRPPRDEHIVVAQTFTQLAQFGYQRTRQTKVPRLILRFALYSLSMGVDPPPPTPVIRDSLSIIAIDLGCDVSIVGATTLDERCVHPSWIVTTLTLDQHPGGASFKPDNSEARNISRSRRSSFAPIQAQGNYCPLPVCSPGGAGWATRDVGCDLTRGKSIEGEAAHVESHHTGRCQTVLWSKPSWNHTCITLHPLGSVDWWGRFSSTMGNGGLCGRVH